MNVAGRRYAVPVVLATCVVLALAYLAWPSTTEEINRRSTQLRSPERDIPTALFIGDSYTAGAGMEEMSPSCLAATRIGWLCALSAVPGTGYISGGAANRFEVDPYIGESTSFIERIPTLSYQYSPEVVVLDGGRNDDFARESLDVFKAMVATIREVHRAWPDTELVVVRPRWMSNPRDDLGLGDGFFASLITAGGVSDIALIDPIGRIVADTSTMLEPDGRHPDRLGRRVLADSLVAEFQGHDLGGMSS